MSFLRNAALAALLSCSAISVASAQQIAPMPAAMPTPQDVAYPGGVIALNVDATDTQRGIFRITETVPVTGPGPFTLLYPQWVPGGHGPRNPINQIAGLQITGNGQHIAWQRDTVNVFAFHVTVPAGVSSLELSYQFVSPTASPQGRIVMTRDMLNIEWLSMVLYPSGYYASRIQYRPSATFPAGWTQYSALDGATREGDTVHWAQTPLDVLVDSPLIAGRYARQIELDPHGPVPVRLSMVADRADQMNPTPAELQAHRNLIQQAYRLYGSHHYDHYDFLFSLSDHMGGNGLEHHRSSEDGVGGDYFTDYASSASSRDLLPHEYTHSWNGKYRRPADLWTPNFDVPMQGSLLWVYEGQTQYWGYVLAGRSGLWTRQQALDALALTAAQYDNRVGRSWRNVQDTTTDPVASQRRPQPWRSWQRSEDYYSEGQLIWLDADTLIRERTHGSRSLDNFAHNFFGVNNGAFNEDTYTFEDIVAALNNVMPYDWAKFLRDRLDETGGHAPLDGITRGGYRLVYTAERSEYQRQAEAHNKGADFTYSIGLSMGEGGAITGVQWDGPAFNQGIAVGASIVSVNGDAYSADVLRRAITAAKDSHDPIQLVVKNGDQYRVIDLDYHGGNRYPHLERVRGTADRIGAIFTAR